FWSCPDCGAPAGTGCDNTCPSAIARDHELVLAEIDAYEDHMATLTAESGVAA
ncbi:hypothetical protein HLX87_25455, partial [Escherichia coli]|nr:hypothetical protein [Escherichia coli]